MAQTENQVPGFPFTISFPDFEPSAAVSTDIQHYMSRLEKYSDRIVSCHVTVRAPQKKSRTHIYHIHVQLLLPGEEIVVTREPEKNYDHSNIHLAVRDAFKAVENQLRSLHSRRSDHKGPQMPEPIIENPSEETNLEML